MEHFGIIRIIDQIFIWFQFLFLFSIMLIPFWNTYIEQFPDNIAIKVLLSLKMVLIGVFSFLSLNYAAKPKNRLLYKTVTDEIIVDAKRQILTEPLIAILAAGLVFIDPILWDGSFILVHVLFFLGKKLINIKYFKSIKE